MAAVSGPVNAEATGDTGVTLLVLVLRPVPPVLVAERQRLERRHAIEEQDAVEMIGLVLDDAGGQSARRELDRAAAAIVRLHLDVASARDETADVRDAEEPIPTGDELVT